jgi:hypothetical protein
MIDYNSLNEDNKLNYDSKLPEENLKGEKFHWYYMPIGQQWVYISVFRSL